MNIEGLREFRNTLAQLLSSAAPGPRTRYVASFQDNEQGDYRLEGIVLSEANNAGIFTQDLPSGHFYSNAVILAEWRPDEPKPTVFDVLELGAICENTHRHYKTADQDEYWSVQVVDHIVVAQDGTWQSVFDLADPKGKTICHGCGYRILHWLDETEDASEWGLSGKDHAPGCPFIAAKIEGAPQPAL